MTDLIRETDNGTIWPYSVAQLLRDEYPHLSLSGDPAPEDLALFRVYRPEPTDPPAMASDQLQAVPAHPVKVAGIWRQGWAVVAAPEPPEPVPDYSALWAGLLVSEVFQAVRAQALESLPLTVAYTDFAAAMAVALAGAPNPDAIAASARSVLAAATLTDDHMAELRELFHAANLDSIADAALVPRRVRARNQDGTFRADDPNTPDTDEAWEVLP